MADVLGFNLSGIGNSALNIIIIIICLIVVGGLLAVVIYYYRYKKRFSAFDVRIWQRDGTGYIHEKRDGGGIFVDKKTGNKLLFLQKNNVGLNPDNIPYLPGMKDTKIVYLWQYGLKNFKFIKPNITETGVELSVGEEDVNWGINTYERSKKMFNTGMLMQLLPYILFAITVVVIMILFIYLFKKFDVIKDAAQALNEASKTLAMAKSGTMVLPT